MPREHFLDSEKAADEAVADFGTFPLSAGARSLSFCEWWGESLQISTSTHFCES